VHWPPGRRLGGSRSISSQTLSAAPWRVLMMQCRSLANNSAWWLIRKYWKKKVRLAHWKPLPRFYIHCGLDLTKVTCTDVLILSCFTYRNNKFISIMGDTTC
jgi:hypothetical protein